MKEIGKATMRVTRIPLVDGNGKTKTQTPRPLTIRKVLVAICGAFLAMFVVLVAKNITQPQIEYSEGFMLYNARLFSNGWNWQMGTEAPFHVAFYTPVIWHTLGFLFKVFGESLLVARLFNLACCIGCLVMVYLITHNQTKDKLVSMIAAALPMTVLTMMGWSFFIRADLMAVLFDLVGVFIVLKYHKTSAVYWAIPIFLLAWYTKQSTVAGVVASCIYLLFQNRKLGVKFTVIFGTVFLALLGVFQITTNGEFIRNILLYQGTVPSFQHPLNILWTLLTSAGLYLPTLILSGIWLKGNYKHFLSIFAVVALVVNVLTLLHTGGTINYLFETIFAMSVLAGLYLGKSEWTEAKTFITLLCSMALLGMLFYSAIWGYKSAFPSQQYWNEYQEAVSLISDSDYPILSENAGIVMDAGKIPYYEPFVFGNLARLCYFDESLVLADLASNKIDYVITQYQLPYTKVQRLSDKVQEAIIENYHMVLDASENSEKGYGFVVYEANNKIGVD